MNLEGKRVLILTSSLAQNNGVANCIMNYYGELCDYCEKVDFLMLKETGSYYEDVVASHNNRFFVIPEHEKYISIKKMKWLNDLIKDNYDIVHVNVPNHNGTAVLLAAKMANVKVRVYHSHAQKLADSFKNKLKALVFDNLCVLFSNHHLACSSIAGDQIFGKQEYEILPNAIHADKFIYSEEDRIRLRGELGLADSIVVGVVGRMSDLKNPFFSVRVFSEFLKLEPSAKLLWLGIGELESKVRELIAELGIQEKCILAGSKSDVYKWYSAMDILLFPSKMEGLGMVLVEAQTSGLFCFSSSNVPRDTAITENIRFYSLSETPADWAAKIADEKEAWTAPRKSHLAEVNSHGFNADVQTISLASLYEKML